MLIQVFRTENKKWFTGIDGYKWLGNDLGMLKNVSALLECECFLRRRYVTRLVFVYSGCFAVVCLVTWSLNGIEAEGKP